MKKVHCQAHLIQAAMALSASERAELLRLRKDNKKLQWSGLFGAIGVTVSFVQIDTAQMKKSRKINDLHQTASQATRMMVSAFRNTGFSLPSQQFVRMTRLLDITMGSTNARCRYLCNPY